MGPDKMSEQKLFLWRNSNEYSQHMFWSKNNKKKKVYTITQIIILSEATNP